MKPTLFLSTAILCIASSALAYPEASNNAASAEGYTENVARDTFAALKGCSGQRTNEDRCSGRKLGPQNSFHNCRHLKRLASTLEVPAFPPHHRNSRRRNYNHDSDALPSSQPQTLRHRITTAANPFDSSLVSNTYPSSLPNIAPSASSPPSPALSTASTTAIVPPSPASEISTSSALHPRVAVILGVDRRWYVPLLVCRALSVAPAAWWGLRCAFTFLAELLRIRPHLWQEGWTTAIVRGDAVDWDWDADRRFRVTEVALAIMWCSASAYLTYFFADCMMSRWLVNYTPPAVVIRLLTTNCLIAYLTSWILYLSGASSDPRLLLPAWVSIASILTFLYHLTQHKINIKKETAASLSVFSIASFISMSCLLLQLHLYRENEPEIPLFTFIAKIWDFSMQNLAVWMDK